MAFFKAREAEYSIRQSQHPTTTASGVEYSTENSLEALLQGSP